MSKIRSLIVTSAVAASAFALAACNNPTNTAATSTDAAPSASSTSNEATSTAQSQSDPQVATVEQTPSTPSIGGDVWHSLAPNREATWEENTLVLHDVRVAAHDGFDRVVLEFAGEGDPGWFLNWTFEALEQGRGWPLPVSKPEALDVVVTGTSMPITDAMLAQYYAGPKVVSAGQTEVVVDGTFEGETHVAIGVDVRRPHQIGLLDSPVRVVIDLQHAQ